MKKKMGLGSTGSRQASNYKHDKEKEGLYLCQVKGARHVVNWKRALHVEEQIQKL